MTIPLGNAPEHMHLTFRLAGAPSVYQPLSRASLSFHVNCKWAYLQAGGQQCVLPDWKSCELRLLWMSPAKGAGFGELSLVDITTGQFTCQLLSGAYQEIAWLKGTGELIAHALGIELHEVDMGSDC